MADLLDVRYTEPARSPTAGEVPPVRTGRDRSPVLGGHLGSVLGSRHNSFQHQYVVAVDVDAR
jgi:hypothetical protein